MTVATDPIFLAGTDRSGIGLLGELLDAHPNLAISRRTNFWSFYYGRFGDLRDPGNLERCITEMRRYTRIRALEPDPVRLRRALADGDPTYARLFAAIQEQHLERVGKRRWGDKSLDSEGHADVIFREFPDARIVHVLRDPRDRYASQANHRQASRGRLGAGTARWLWSARTAERNGAQHPHRYAVVRYEDLVSRPSEVLGQVCDFLGEEFTPDMLALPSAGTAATRELTTASVGRFRRDLTRRELAFVDLLAGRRMARWGYPASGVTLSWRERVAFVGRDLPMNLTRMALFHLRRRSPERTGPRPSQRRVAPA